jgi:hypothetical protein
MWNEIAPDVGAQQSQQFQSLKARFFMGGLYIDRDWRQRKSLC